jgi:hypothetical protein
MSVRRWVGSVLIAVLVAASLLALGAERVAAATHTVPTSVASDCSRDVTGQLRSWLRSLPAGSTAQLSPSGCYRVDGTIELQGRNGLAIDGRSATLRAMTEGDPHRATWRFIDSSSIALRNLAVQGSLPPGAGFRDALQWQHAFDFRGVRGVTLEHVRASGVYGDGVYIGLGDAAPKAWTSTVRIRDMRIGGAGRMGVVVVAGRDVLVENSSLSGIGLTPLIIEPNGLGDGAEDVTFRRNRVSGPLTRGFFATLGKGPVRGVRVQDNTLTGAGMHMSLSSPEGVRRSGYTITGNRSDRGYSAPGSAAFIFRRIDGATVRDNAVPLIGANMALVATYASCGISVSGNTFTGGLTQARFDQFACAQRNTVGAAAR